MHQFIDRCFAVRGEVVTTSRVEITDIGRVADENDRTRVSSGSLLSLSSSLIQSSGLLIRDRSSIQAAANQLNHYVRPALFAL